jgi:hypothetical protein
MATHRPFTPFGTWASRSDAKAAQKQFPFTTKVCKSKTKNSFGAYDNAFALVRQS